MSSALVTVTSTSISLAGARVALDAALARAAEIGVQVCVCIVDLAGHAVLTARMDGAALMAANIAADKAYTVATFKGIPTDQWVPSLEGRPEVREGLNKMPRFCILGGGLPVHLDGVLVGAIGVSGASTEEDVDVATAGLRAFAALA